MAYAQNTNVSVERTRAEIETVLRKYGAEGFQSSWEDRDGKTVARIEFLKSDKHVRFMLTLPGQSEKQFTHHRGQGYRHKFRTPEGRHKAWEQACRQRWRALLLCIKAKIEAVAAGITQFEDEFLAQFVDPVSNKTIGEMAGPMLKKGRLNVSGLLGLPSPETAHKEPQ